MPPSDVLPALKRLIGLLCLLAALGLGYLALGSLPPAKRREQWRGFRTLLVEVAVPEGEVLAKLQSAGMKELVSESTQPVLVSSWAGLETLSLSAARLRLVPGDPRLDDYLRRLGLWFAASSRGQNYRAYYIKDSAALGSSGVKDGRLERALAGFEGHYILPGSGQSPAAPGGPGLFFAFAAFLLAAAIVARPLLGRGSSLSRGLAARRIPRIALDRMGLRLSLALPWAVLARGSFPAAVPTLLCALAIIEAADLLDLPVEEYRRGRGFKEALSSIRGQGVPGLALPLVALLAAVANPALLGSLALAALGSLAAILGYALLSGPQFSRTPFIPLPIGPVALFSRRAVSAAGSLRAVLACALLLAWVLGSLLLSSHGTSSSQDVDLPLPVAVSGSLRPLIDEARRRASGENGEVPPGLASFLRHRAEQEALPFIRLGEGRPDPFAPALFPMPPPETAGVTFGDGWARAAYAELPALSVEGMLLRQGSATVARRSSLGGDGGRPLAPIGYLLYILLLIPPIGRILLGVPNARGVISSDLRQEA